MSIEQSICNNLSTALNDISIANGYSFDVGGNVFEWRDTDLKKTEVPGIIWRDHLNEFDPDGEESHKLYFHIIVVASGNTSPATIRNMVQDAMTAFLTLENPAVFDPKHISGCYFVKITKAVERHENKVSAAEIDCYVEYTAGLGSI